MSLVKEKEKEFTAAYHFQIKLLQNKCEDGMVAYTKLTLSFALLHNLPYIEVLFHPKSIAKHKSYERPNFSIDTFKQTLEAIIVYELGQSLDQNRLSPEVLLKTIECFRSLDQKKLT